MFARILPVLVMSIGLATLSGCGPDRLDFSKTVTLEAVEFKMYDLDAQSKPQTFTIKYESTPEPVTISVYRTDDAKEPDMAKPANALGSESGKTSGTFTVPIPAKTAVRVVISGAKKKTEVKLNLTNRG